MESGLLINPILLHPSHTTATGNATSRPSPIEFAYLGSIAEGLKTIMLVAWIPVIHGYLNRHTATP